MIISNGYDFFSAPPTERYSQFAEDSSGDSFPIDPIEDDSSRYEQVIRELTEFENAQCKAEEEEVI